MSRLFIVRCAKKPQIKGDQALAVAALKHWNNLLLHATSAQLLDVFQVGSEDPFFNTWKISLQKQFFFQAQLVFFCEMHMLFINEFKTMLPETEMVQLSDHLQFHLAIKKDRPILFSSFSVVEGPEWL